MNHARDFREPLSPCQHIYGIICSDLCCCDICITCWKSPCRPSGVSHFGVLTGNWCDPKFSQPHKCIKAWELSHHGADFLHSYLSSPSPDPHSYLLPHTPWISIPWAPPSVSWRGTETQQSPHPQHGLGRVMEHTQHMHGLYPHSALAICPTALTVLQPRPQCPQAESDCITTVSFPGF